LSHLWPTGSSAGQPPSITARYFSSCPSDSTSRWTPCPPQNHLVLRPARHYPRFWIWHPSSECQRDFNPPEQCAAQRTSGRRWRIRFRCWPPSAAQTARAVFPHAAFTKIQRFEDAREGINPTRFTSPYSPKSVAVGSCFQPQLRQRLNRCDQMRRTIHRSSWLKSFRTCARL
jgi:hypothetical protein